MQGQTHFNNALAYLDGQGGRRPAGNGQPAPTPPAPQPTRNRTPKPKTYKSLVGGKIQVCSAKMTDCKVWLNKVRSSSLFHGCQFRNVVICFFE